MKRAFITVVAAALALSGFAFTYPTMGVAKWTVYMMGIDTDGKLNAAKSAVAGKSTVKVAFVNSEQGTASNYEHDDFMQSEVEQIASYLSLPLQVIRMAPSGTLGSMYQAAVNVADIVVDFRSYWSELTINSACEVIAANPDKLFILPYGEIADCPATSTSLQGRARHADGTGYANLINTIPLAHSYGGKLMRPLRRTTADTSTVTFVSPSAWASGIGETCPSAASCAAAAAFVFAAHGGRPTASEIVSILSQGAGLPSPSTAAQFSDSDLATLKSELSALTVTDGEGRKMLLYGNCINLQGALDVMNEKNNAYHGVDTFEGFAVGTSATAINGWSGDGDVCAESYSPRTPPGYPVTNAVHKQVLWAYDSVRNIPDAARSCCRIDMMVKVIRGNAPLPDGVASHLISLSVNADGRFNLWAYHENEGIWNRGWSVLSDEVFADGEWVRVGIEIDTASNPAGHAFARIRINGSCAATGRGFRAPDDPTEFGCWYCVARAGVDAIAEPSVVGFSDTEVDDLAFLKAETVEASTGADSVSQIPFAWFDAFGMPRDPSMSAPWLAGYTLGDAYDAGLDPYSSDPLTLSDISLDDSGHLELRFNGFKGEAPTADHFGIIRSNSADFSDKEELPAAAGTFASDLDTHTTIWRSALPVGNGGFYRIRGKRSAY